MTHTTNPLERRALDAQLLVTILVAPNKRVHLVRDDIRFAECGVRLPLNVDYGTIRRADFARLCGNCRRVMGEVLERREHSE